MASDHALSSQHMESISKSLHERLFHPGSHGAAAAVSAEEELHCNTPIATGTARAYTDAEPHAVMVPYPLQGHINPMMEFAKMLITKAGLRVTFINNKHNHDRIQGALASTASMKFTAAAQYTHDHSSKLQLLWLDNGLPADFDYINISWDRLRQLCVATFAMRDPFKELLQSLNQKGLHVSCVVFGSFCPWANSVCPWANSVAVELGIPSFFFWTQSTTVFSMYYHAPLLAARGFFPYRKNSTPGCMHEDADEPHKASDCMVSYVPGVPSLPPSSFPTLFHIDDLSNSSFAFMQKQFGILGECQGVIINSFEELEKEAAQAVHAELLFPVYHVGPLIPSAFLGGNIKNDTTVHASLLQENNECIKWLDSQEKHSVVYVSFGTMCSPSSEDLEAIACGIKSSKQPFMWVIRPTSSLQHVCAILPEDFIEDTKEYGLIIPWAPQMQVLSHPSIGAFLTHCGWNSTLESLSMGVPMIPFPIFSDQTTNCAYVCNVWKVGMALKRGDDGKVMSEGVKRVVRTVLHEEEGKEMRKRAGRVKEAARQAVLSRGSSSEGIESFIQGMKTHMEIRCKMREA